MPPSQRATQSAPISLQSSSYAVEGNRPVDGRTASRPGTAAASRIGDCKISARHGDLRRPSVTVPRSWTEYRLGRRGSLESRASLEEAIMPHRAGLQRMTRGVRAAGRMRECIRKGTGGKSAAEPLASRRSPGSQNVTARIYISRKNTIVQKCVQWVLCPSVNRTEHRSSGSLWPSQRKN